MKFGTATGDINSKEHRHCFQFQLRRNMSASRPVSALSALSASSSEVEKPRTRAQTAPKKPNTRKRTTAAAAAAKKPVTRTASRKGSKAKTTTTKKKTTTKVALSRPTWKDMIRECIVENKDDARVGVSRTTIKKVCFILFFAIYFTKMEC